MIRSRLNSKDPDIINSMAAMKRAAKAALERGLRTGTPVWVIKNGKMVDLAKAVRAKRSAAKARAKKSRKA